MIDRLIQSAGQDGINKLVAGFLAKHPKVSKRQAEIKINELAVKEKRADDKYIVWHVRPEYQQFIDMTPEEAAVAAASIVPSEAPTSAKKRKKAEMNDDEDGEGEGAAANSASLEGFSGKEPKRYKRAFGFFVKAKRADAEAQLGTSASVSACFILSLTNPIYFICSSHSLCVAGWTDDRRAEEPAHLYVGGHGAGGPRAFREEGGRGPGQVPTLLLLHYTLLLQ